jgi:hypothetical protein
MIDRVTLFCLAASACLVAMLPLELRSDVTNPALPAPPIAKPNETVAMQRDGPAVNQRIATALARPLFSATRRPAETEASAHPDTSLNDLRLTGIVIMPHQHFVIFTGSDGKPLVRSEGEMISDWRIDGIAAQSISLTGPTGAKTLEPKADPHLNRLLPPIQPAAPPPQPATSAANSPPAPASKTPFRPRPVFKSER